MILTRSPLRITLGGGGTDVPSYYSEYGGFLVAAAIDKYVYIALNHRFIPKLLLKYSQLEEIAIVDDIKHPIFREALKYVGIEHLNLEITSMADIPAGTGLGSSGSFTTALLKALHVYKKNMVHPRDLAEQACYIEINRLKEPIGKQDQYIAAYGGITAFDFAKDGQVQAKSVKMSEETRTQLEENLLLFFTGYTRSASTILKNQDDKSRKSDIAMLENLHFTKELGWQSLAAIEAGDLREFAHLMDIHWQRKRARTTGMSNDHIDAWYQCAMANGAIGGKLIGAGSGGFLMFFAEKKGLLRQAMKKQGLQEVQFQFDFEGTKVVLS